MMEILFRGKAKFNGRHHKIGVWVYGSLIIKSVGVFIYVIEKDDLGNIIREFEVEVIHETVGQLIELTDKNGTKIFKGDICRTRYSGKYGDPNSDLLVCTDFNDFIYLVLYSEDHSGLNGCMQSDLEVIGNIHDNPELVPNQNNDL